MIGATRDDELLDLLMDMKHDLGKYLVMPIAMLPRDATEGMLRDGLREALHHTRTSGGEERSAAQLWEAFVTEGGPSLRALPSFDALQARVDAALGWGARLEDAGALDRDALLQDLRAVGETIGAMIATLEGD